MFTITKKQKAFVWRAKSNVLHAVLWTRDSCMNFSVLIFRKKFQRFWIHHITTTAILVLYFSVLLLLLLQFCVRFVVGLSNQYYVIYNIDWSSPWMFTTAKHKLTTSLLPTTTTTVRSSSLFIHNVRSLCELLIPTTTFKSCWHEPAIVTSVTNNIFVVLKYPHMRSVTFYVQQSLQTTATTKISIYATINQNVDLLRKLKFWF